MSGILRIIGIVNAAIWFGAGIFFAAAILPAVFSPEMHTLFHDAGNSYYTGAVAMTLFKRFFLVQYICGVLALAHLLAEKLYLGRLLPRLGTILVLIVFGLGLLGGLVLEPHMEHLRQGMFFGHTVELQADARRSFWIWHGISQFMNIIMLCGLAVHLIRVTKAPESGRYATFYQIP